LIYTARSNSKKDADHEETVKMLKQQQSENTDGKEGIPMTSRLVYHQVQSL
jgi:hypothetical protein